MKKATAHLNENEFVKVLFSFVEDFASVTERGKLWSAFF